ncbi:MAG: HAMP domain-containing histidine kinase [Phycisphaerales bacterium]|nr:HAMP domain-containing histidine kinase [Phycisphaerales bacterium]
MKRPLRTWLVFAAALLVALTVMVFFSAKMLQLERSIAEAQARATLEESVRLALWRMDSLAAVLQTRNDARALYPGNSNLALEAPAQQLRITEQQKFQAARNIGERQQREALNELINEQSIATQSASPPDDRPPPDWRDLEPTLLQAIADILPGASLEPAPIDKPGDPDPRRLATIPARLVVPDSALPRFSLPWNTPLRTSLMLAWACIVLAAGAIALVLASALSLGARRAAFASAVTHELRTPLTTFRMYSEMLASGVISDPAARAQYLQTLVAESDRLTHLIENVMAYSRLENRAAPRALETLAVDHLIEQALPALRRRADQAGVTISIDADDRARTLRLTTDPVAVQQILLNLVDNACKYARTDITLAARASATFIDLIVSDRGPGLSQPADRAFAAFNKSRTDAIPGIGLGLYLSRQLARNLRGDLTHRPAGASCPQSGATFALSLPRGV